MKKISDNVWEVDGKILNLCHHEGFKNFVDFTKDGFVTILNSVLPKMTHAPGSIDDTIIPINVSPAEHYKNLANGLVDVSLDTFEETGRQMVKLLAIASVVSEINKKVLPETPVTKLFSIFVNNAYDAVHCSMDSWKNHQEYQKFMMDLKNSGFPNKANIVNFSFNRGEKKLPTPKLSIPWIMRTGVFLRDSDCFEKNLLLLASETIMTNHEVSMCEVRIFRTYMSIPSSSQICKMFIFSIQNMFFNKNEVQSVKINDLTFRIFEKYEDSEDSEPKTIHVFRVIN